MKNKNPPRLPSPPWRRALGLSLIELMVALAIGSFLIAGAVWVYVESRKNYTVNEALARMQENARYAMSTVEPDVRLANYWGLVNDPQLIRGARDNHPIGLTQALSDCGPMFPIDLRRPIEGVNQNGYAADPVPCTADTASAGTRLASADTLVVRRADESLAPAGGGKLQVYTTRSGIASSLFIGNPPGETVVDPVFGPQTEIRDLVVRAYYVAAGSSLPGQPSLRRRNLVGGAAGPRFVDEEVLPGVEDLQIQFGIDPGVDENRDGTPDDRDGNGKPDRYSGIAQRYVNPGDAALANAQVVAVRVWLRVRADAPEQGFIDDKPYNYADVSYRPSGADARYRRMLVSRTIQLRNTVNLQT